jgi:ABC-2 type transport system ATP-binding protein
MSRKKGPAILQIKDLFKSYKDVKAVSGISFEVHENEIFGLVGPNGAGKTTTLEMIEGLRKPDSGEIILDGMSVSKQLKNIKEIIGIQLQSTAVFEKLTVYETIELFGSFYSNQKTPEELLELINMKDKMNARTEGLSGGQMQRLSIALALVNDPKILFLDEPTTGLDPQARRNIWEIIEDLSKLDKTIIMTTHYMEEAEQLCDRIAVMDFGKVIALDTPDKLIQSLGQATAIEFNYEAGLNLDILKSIPGVLEAKRDDGNYILYSKDVQASIVGMMSVLDKTSFSYFHIRNATLEDVFLELTGRRVRE